MHSIYFVRRYKQIEHFARRREQRQRERRMTQARERQRGPARVGHVATAAGGTRQSHRRATKEALLSSSPAPAARLAVAAHISRVEPLAVYVEDPIETQCPRGFFAHTPLSN